MISLNLKNTKKSDYTIEGDKFIINSRDRSLVDKGDYSKVVSHSLLHNDVVKIYELTETVAVTEFYADYLPMIIIDHNNFYGDEVFLERSAFHCEFVKDVDRVTALYNSIVDAHVDFMGNTGYFFYDAGGNNIMVNSDYTSFKIIDVFGINKIAKHKIPNVPLVFDPINMFLSGYVSFWGKRQPPQKVLTNKMLTRFLSGVNIEEVIGEVFSQIPLRKWTKEV
tara:strand:- start:112 stop:780 length:669 start_codon:yes stop_codon:yes gene_type:complete